MIGNIYEFCVRLQNHIWSAHLAVRDNCSHEEKRIPCLSIVIFPGGSIAHGAPEADDLQRSDNDRFSHWNALQVWTTWGDNTNQSFSIGFGEDVRHIKIASIIDVIIDGIKNAPHHDSSGNTLSIRAMMNMANHQYAVEHGERYTT